MVSIRGLLQATLCCMLLLVAAIPRPLASAPGPKPNPFMEAVFRANLTQYIARTYHKPKELVSRIVDTAFREGHKANIAPTLVLGMVAQESSFSPKAQSSYGAQGLMQVVPRIHKKEIQKLPHPAKLFHPESNMAVGTGILQGYIKSADGNVDRALARYSGKATAYSHKVRGYAQEFDTAMLQPVIESRRVAVR